MGIRTCPRCKAEKDEKDFQQNGYCTPCALAKYKDAYERSKLKKAAGGTVKAKKPKAQKREKLKSDELVLPAAWGLKAHLEDNFLQITQEDAEGNVDTVMVSRSELAILIDRYGGWAAE